MSFNDNGCRYPAISTMHSVAQESVRKLTFLANFRRGLTMGMAVVKCIDKADQYLWNSRRLLFMIVSGQILTDETHQCLQ
jgi:hypothetical protein